MEGTRFSSNISVFDGISSPMRTSMFNLKNRLDVTPKTHSHIEFQFQITPKRKSTTKEVKKIPKVSPKKKFRKISWDQDFYEGEVLLDNLHGQGFYTTIKDGKKLFCDGQFYVNKLEGYSQVFYDDATHFQGLFRQHCRYGPGVLTHPDGTQDVGFWDGFKLIRLSCLVSSSKTVPGLAHTALGRSRLMGGRTLVDLNEPDEVLNIVENLEDVEDVADILEEVFNMDIRHRSSLFFHKQLYDAEFFGDVSNNIKVITDDLQEFQFDRLAERKGSLRNKINELTESFNTFSDIKKALQEKIDICTKCCNRECVEVRITQQVPQRVSLGESEVVSDSLSITLSEFSGRSGGSERKDTQVEEEQDNQSAMELIKTYLKHVCECAEEAMGIGDLQKLEDQIRNVGVQEAYYRVVQEELTKKLDRIVEREFQQHKFKLVPVNHLFAWNNEQCMIQMQKHCFKHRNTENLVNFDVAKLIRGERRSFGPKSTHETTCHHFLLSCFKGDLIFIKNCLRTSKVHPNLADVKGNTGVFYAVAGNQKCVIPFLTNFGCKLDQLNDEQLTPLNLALLMYIACLNSYTDWETSFLMEILPKPLPDVPSWYDIRSFLSMSSSSDSRLKSGSSQCLWNKRLMKLIRTNSRPMFSTKGQNLYAFDLQCNIRTEPVQQVDNKINLENILWTIGTLLEYGASPKVGETPYPPLILALFTENPDIVGEMLKAKADASIMINENLTCLHVAASLSPSGPNAVIFKLLLESGLNPNARTHPAHWAEKSALFKGKIPEGFDIEDKGKTPLHLLCMRTDYISDESNEYFPTIAMMLLQSDVDVKDEYLGHSALSLAVISGNIHLIECLITSDKFNPYQPLGYGMGNILTLYALDRFSDILSPETCKLILGRLVELNVNVLYKVGDAENAVVFAEDFDIFFDDTKKGKRKVGSSNKRHTLIVEFLKILARQCIVKRLQIIVTKMLYNFIEQGVVEGSEIAATLCCQYLNPQQAAKCLEKLFQSGTLHEVRQNDDNVKALLMYVDIHKKADKKGAKKEKKSGMKKGKENSSEKNAGPVEEEHGEKRILKMMKDLDLKFRKREETCSVVTPGLDDATPYKVCFHCLRKKHKDLQICPRCQVISFCSATCNKNNNKLKDNPHDCNIIFYSVEQDQQEMPKYENLAEIMEIVERDCMTRLNVEIARRLQEEHDQLMALWRADTYGTKILKIKKLLEVAAVNQNEKGDLINVQLTQLKSILNRVTPKRPFHFSWDTLMSKLKSKSQMQTTSPTTRSLSTRLSSLAGTSAKSVSLMWSDVAKAVNELRKSEVILVPSARCRCPTNVDVPPTRPKSPQSYMINVKKADITDDTMRKLMSAPEKKLSPRKLNTIPERYQQFVETVSRYFPELDMSSWLLPYTCCNDGQLYYQFFDTKLFKESYSFS